MKSLRDGGLLSGEQPSSAGTEGPGKPGASGRRSSSPDVPRRGGNWAAGCQVRFA